VDYAQGDAEELIFGSAASVKRMDLSFYIHEVHVKPSSSIPNLGVLIDLSIFWFSYFFSC